MEVKVFDIFHEEECIEVLQNALNCDKSNIQIKNFKIITVDNPEAVGMLGEYFQLIINAEIKGNITNTEKFEFFVKSIPVSDIYHAQQIQKSGMFPKEIGLYTSLFKEMDKYQISRWHPNCYYVRPDLLVMEDLHKKNYTHLSQTKYLVPIDHLKSVLKSLAAMHANSIIFEEKTGINIGEKYAHLLEESLIKYDCDLFRVGVQAIQGVAKTIPKFQTNSEVSAFISNKFMKCIDRMAALVEPSKKFRNVLCHRDLWTKNYFFKYERGNPSVPIDCLFVDFQLARYNPPALDGLIFIYLNTQRKMREAHINELLQFYYDYLRTDLQSVGIDVEKHTTWDEFLESCEEFKIIPVVLTGIFAHLARLPAGYLEEFRKRDSEKYNYCVNVDRVEFVLERMEDNPMYKENILECVEEIVEFLIMNL